ncbi:hypothetical protein [Nocardia sp. NPDC005978]|uniref:hypothetical protein n=1 Tax=unclassified Nocardia TaxID=2637762 RepID=UPI0033BCD341
MATSSPLTTALAHSHHPATRLSSIPALAAHIHSAAARRRLEELLDDFLIPVQADAAAALVLHGGAPGRAAVRAAIARRPGDPDADYLAYALETPPPAPKCTSPANGRTRSPGPR